MDEKDGQPFNPDGIPKGNVGRMVIGQMPPAYRKGKHRGRKAGSKNKPKPPKPPEIDQLATLKAELQALRAIVQDCCALLLQASTIRIGQMDSESRVADLTKQQSALAGEAYTRLRSML